MTAVVCERAKKAKKRSCSRRAQSSLLGIESWMEVIDIWHQSVRMSIDDVERWFLGQKVGSMNQIRGRATHFSYGLNLNPAIAVAGRMDKASTNF